MGKPQVGIREQQFFIEKRRSSVRKCQKNAGKYQVFLEFSVKTL